MVKATFDEEDLDEFSLYYCIVLYQVSSCYSDIMEREPLSVGAT